MKERVIAVFVTTHETMLAEKTFKTGGVKFRTALKPRKLGGSCQMALTFAPEIFQRARDVVKESGLKLEGFYRQDGEGEWTPL
ncbi:MAG: DUF3343 domain-containing protein [Nitrospinae bacterium]|nr:DUF3343 domain-containing protein [Nitrospinota bacterium]